MNILFLISGGDTGGAKTHMFALLDALRGKAGIKLVCFMDGVFYKEVTERDIDTVLLPQKSRFDMSVANSIEKIIKDDKIDVVHCHGARANFITAKMKKRIPCPVVTTMHSDYLLDFDGFYRKIVYTGLNIWALRKMDYYIAVSSNFKKMLISRGFKPNSIFTVYNGMDFDTPFSFDEKDEFLRRVGIEPKEGEIYIGIMGRHDSVKGHDIFIKGCLEVAKKCNNVKFLIAGDREGEEPLRDLIEGTGFEDRFVFCGFVRDIYSFINVIDINTITSRSESFPYVMLEGARLKKPLVSSEVGGISDLVKDGETGLLFASENYEEFAEKLMYLIENPDERQRLGENIYERATSVFSSQNLAQEHLKIYASLLRYKNETKKYDVVLSGYYGFNNCGDDALLFSILEDLRKLMPDIRALVLTNKPKEGKEISMIDTVHRFSPFGLYKALKSTKMLISGGGSLIQDATSSQSLYYYLYVIRLAKKLGAYVYVFANGIGPIKKKNEKYVKKTLKYIDRITLRDEMSAEELKRISPDTEYLVTADPAIEMSGEKKCPGRKIGISVRDWVQLDSNFEYKMATVLDEIYQRYSLTPVFIPMKFPDDIKISKRIMSKMNVNGEIIENKLNAYETVDVIASMDIIVGMRLHTLIFAAGNCVPCVGIIYDPKIRGFMEYIGQDKLLDASDFDTEKMLEYTDIIIRNTENEKEKLKKNSDRLKALALKNSEIAVEILK